MLVVYLLTWMLKVLLALKRSVIDWFKYGEKWKWDL